MKKTIERESIKKDGDDDSSSSSSESDEKSTKPTPSKTNPTVATKPRTSRSIFSQIEHTFHFIARQRVTKADAKRRTPAIKRTVNVKNCDDDDSVLAKDDDTLVGRIVVSNCACQKRFSNNASRLAAVARTVTTQLQLYFQKLYNTKVNYPTTVRVVAGNRSHTVFNYIVKVPKANHGQAKAAMKQACKDEEVISIPFCTTYIFCLNQYVTIDHVHYLLLYLGEEVH